MTTTKHTPGPWAVTINVGPEVESHCQEDGPIGICTLYNPERWGRDIQEAAANSYLIAAAPDLLQAVKAAKEMVEWFMANSRQADHAHSELGKKLEETEGWKELIDSGYNGLMASYGGQFEEALAKTEGK